jgi:ribosome-associated toxin RatA of RatAB toxin-antitoxin module
MIEIKLTNGPFKYLYGYWQFESLGLEGSKIMLDLNFDFSGSFLDLAFGPIFNQFANSLVEAFCKRAEHVYGPR